MSEPTSADLLRQTFRREQRAVRMEQVLRRVADMAGPESGNRMLRTVLDEIRHLCLEVLSD